MAPRGDDPGRHGPAAAAAPPPVVAAPSRGAPAPGPVLHVVRVFGRISETFVVDTMAAVQREGWPAWVATRAVDAGHPFAFPPGDRIAVASPPGPLRTLRDLAALRGYGEREEVRWPDAVARAGARLVHAHFGWAALDALPVARRHGLPLVVTFHGSDVTVYPRVGRRERLLLRAPRRAHKYERAFPRFDGVIAVSRFLERRLRALGLEGPVDIIPAGVRLEDFPFRGALPPGAGPTLLFVGRLVPRKAPELAIEALARVRRSHHGAVLEIVGDGPEREALGVLARRLGVADAVTFLGAQPRPGVIAAMHRAHVHVMPSRTMPDGEAEGSPVVTKEAQAIGVPVVATDNGGTRETIPPEDRARLVPEDDVEALAGAIARVLDERDDWPARVARARRFVEQEFDWRRLGGRTTDVYARACARRAAPQP